MYIRLLQRRTAPNLSGKTGNLFLHQPQQFPYHSTETLVANHASRSIDRFSRQTVVRQVNDAEQVLVVFQLQRKTC